MVSVIFHSEDNSGLEAKSEEQLVPNPVRTPNVLPASPVSYIRSAAEPAVPEAADSSRKALPSLEIPAGTVGKIPKAHTLRVFVKSLIITYVIAIVVGIGYAILLA